MADKGSTPQENVVQSDGTPRSARVSHSDDWRSTLDTDNASRSEISIASETSWQVGCMRINPTTSKGQIIFVLQTVIVTIFPMIGLLLQNGLIINWSLSSQSEYSSTFNLIFRSLGISSVVKAIQNERTDMVMSVLHNSNNLNRKFDISLNFEDRFNTTNKAIDNLVTWPEVEDFPFVADYVSSFKSKSLFQIDLEVFRIHVQDGRLDDVSSILSWYEIINKLILLHLDTEIKMTNRSVIWKHLIAFENMLRAMEHFGMGSLYGIKSWSSENLTSEDIASYLSHDTLSWEYVNCSVNLAPHLGQKTAELYKQSSYKFYKESLASLSSEEAQNGTIVEYFNFVNDIVESLRVILKELKDEISAAADEEYKSANLEKVTGFIIIFFMMIVSVAFGFSVHNAIFVIKILCRELCQKLHETEVEVGKTERALYGFLPTTVLPSIRLKETVAEHFDCVTIFHADILEFNKITSNCSANEVISFVTSFLQTFDARTVKFDVQSVYTFGDQFLVVSGMPRLNGNHHAKEIAKMALEILAGTVVFQVPHRPLFRLQLRMGIHSGPASGVVVGYRIPFYCVTGQAINIAVGVEKSGEGLRIHISEATKRLLDDSGGFRIEYRGVLDLGGSFGEMDTFWLVGIDQEFRPSKAEPKEVLK